MTPGRGAATLALVAALVGAAPAWAADPLPEPDLVIKPEPVPLDVQRPLIEPPPPLPSLRVRGLEVGPPPLPPFATAVRKGFPPPPDVGGFPCGLATMLGRPLDLLRCGIARIYDGELDRARQALEEALGAEPPGEHAAAASLWLAEIEFHQDRLEAATARYQAALERGIPPDLSSHAAVALATIALRRGNVDGTIAALRRATGAVPPAMAVLARFLDGVARLLRGDGGTALSIWAEIAPTAPADLRPELLFWRGVAFLQRWEPEPGLQALDQAFRAFGADHPLYAEALAQRGWAQLMRGNVDRALSGLERAAGAAPAIRRRHLPGLVRAHAAMGRFRDARDAARRLGADPGAASLLLHVAEEAQRRQAFHEALETYAELRTHSADPALRARATYRIAEVLEQLAAASRDPGIRQRAVAEYRRLRDEGGDEGLAQRAAYWLALAALQEGRPAAALAEAEDLLRSGPSAEIEGPALILAAEAAARAGAPNRAVRLYRSALGAMPDSPRSAELSLALGWALREDGEVGVALQEWQRATRLGHEQVTTAAYQAIAATALATGYDAEALSALEELERRLPPDAPRELLRLERGIVLARLGDDAGALELLRPLLRWRTAPEREAAVRRTLGIALYRTGRYPDAQAMFQEAAQREPGVAANWLGAGLAAYRRGRADEADAALQRARLSTDPEIAATAAYALVLVRSGDPVELRRRAGAFIAAYPGEPHSAVLVSRLVRDALAARLGEYALSWMQWLAKEQPTSPVLEEVLAQLAQAEHGDPALARKVYQEVVARTRQLPTKLLARVGLARAAAALSRPGEAREALGAFIDEAPADDPRLPWAYGQLVRLYEAEGHRDRVLATAEAFLARFPRDPAAPAMQLRRGELLMAEQRWHPAREALEAARDSGDPAVAAQAHVRLGELFRAQGEHDAAVEEYLGAAYLYPGTRAAALGLQGVAQTYVRLERPRDARIALEKLVSQAGADAALVQWARDEIRRLSRPAGATAPPAARTAPARSR